MCNIYLDERKLLEEMKDINLTQDDFIEVSDNNIQSLLYDEEEDSYDENCLDEDFEMTGF